jgi:transcriptional regulator with XRE-family HTH domain
LALKDRLKTLRKENGWTLKEVASKLGLSGHSTYSNWEYGRTEPDIEMLKTIAELYNVTVEYLLSGEKQNNIERKDSNTYDLEELLKTKKITWGNEELNDEESRRAIEMLRLLLDKQKDTIR